AAAPLLALLEVPTDDPAWAALDPPQRRQRTLDALRQLLLQAARQRPLVVVIEDLQWADAETQALLDALVDGMAAAPLALLLNYRPEYRHHWGGKSYYTQLRLDPLPADAAGALLQALLGRDAALAPVAAMLRERTAGNPLFLEESVRALVETGALRGKPGDYRLVRPVPAVEVPASVQAVLAARIDRLAPNDKRLLQCAAVIGYEPSPPASARTGHARRATPASPPTGRRPCARTPSRSPSMSAPSRPWAGCRTRKRPHARASTSAWRCARHYGARAASTGSRRCSATSRRSHAGTASRSGSTPSRASSRSFTGHRATTGNRSSTASAAWPSPTRATIPRSACARPSI